MSETETVLLMEGLFGEAYRERRRSPRKKSSFADVLISDQSMLNFWQGNVLDCSPEGMGLRVGGGKPAVGTVLYVRRTGSPNLNASLVVEVIHSQRYDRDTHFIGCRFIEPPKPQVLVLFG